MSGRRLVVVDDDAEIGAFVRAVAEGIGFEVETYTDADGFEAALGRDDPDLVILDIAMPGTDGIELLRSLAARKSRAAVFIMSGYDASMREMAFRLGEEVGNLDMRQVIPKPVRVADLRAILIEAMPKSGESMGV